MSRFWTAALTVVICSVIPATATTYPPVTFDELVARADVIFLGEVIDVRPFPLPTRDGTIIKTRVTFRVSDAIWGTTAALEVFDFFGGEWGGIGMAIADMPAFAVGDRRVVFAYRDSRTINPIVGFTQGLLQIVRDSSGVDRVLTSDGMPLDRPESIGASRAAVSAAPAVPMRLTEFRSRISRALAEARRR